MGITGQKRVRSAVVVKTEPAAKVGSLSDSVPLANDKEFANVPKCDQHSSEECTFWCDKCNMAVCMMCVKVDHRGHYLVLLESVIDVKVNQSLGKLKYLQDKMSIVDQNIQTCKSEQLFHTNQIELFKKRQEQFEMIRATPSMFEIEKSKLKQVANGAKNVHLNGSVLGKLLQLARVTDDQLFLLESTEIVHAFAWPSKSETVYVNGFSYSLIFNLTESHSFWVLIDCSNSEKKHFSSKVDLKLSILHPKPVYTLTKTVMAHVFTDETGRLALKILSHWPIAEFLCTAEKKLSFVLEIYHHGAEKI